MKRTQEIYHNDIQQRQDKDALNSAGTALCLLERNAVDLRPQIYGRRLSIPVRVRSILEPKALPTWEFTIPTWDQLYHDSHIENKYP